MGHSRANEWNSGGGFSPLPVTVKKKTLTTNEINNYNWPDDELLVMNLCNQLPRLRRQEAPSKNMAKWQYIGLRWTHDLRLWPRSVWHGSSSSKNSSGSGSSGGVAFLVKLEPFWKTFGKTTSLFGLYFHWGGSRPWSWWSHDFAVSPR